VRFSIIKNITEGKIAGRDRKPYRRKIIGKGPVYILDLSIITTEINDFIKPDIHPFEDI
jgi:hypothetical protein